MCGIAGFTGSSQPDLLKRMTDIIRHRGPDGEGAYASEGINLGHRRLAIIDRAGSQQPFIKNGACISYNGEIYNYRQVKSALESEGVTFNSSGDTEVLLE